MGFLELYCINTPKSIVQCQNFAASIHFVSNIYIYICIHTVDGQIIQTLHPLVVGSPLFPKFQCYGSISWLLLPGFDLFRPFEGANQPQKRNIVIGGAGVLGLQGFE